jgi:hypothetical protein
MLGSALVYSAVMLGPWGVLKSAAYHVGSLPWLAYALTFLIFIFILLPGAFALAVRGGQILAGQAEKLDRHWLRTRFVPLAYTLVPLGLAAWIAFSLAFVFANFSYLWPALSDPFGWGWNLFGTAGLAWTPYLTQMVPVLQAVVLIGGLSWAARIAHRIASQVVQSGRKSSSNSSGRLAFPVVLFCLLITAGLMGLLLA